MVPNAMQGDQYAIPITKSGFDVADVAKIRFIIGPLLKEYPGAVTYDATNSRFLFPVTQQETLAMKGTVSCEARIQFSGSNDIRGVKMGFLRISETMDRVVI